MNRTTLPLLILIGLTIVALVSPDAFSGAQRLLGNIVGVGATVPANPVNTYMAELDAREKELVLREQALARDRERTALWIALTVVAGLVGVNFILDWRRRA